MNIDEAIKYSEVILEAPETATFPKPQEAIKLLIEAGKAVKRYRLGLVHWPEYFLPSETEE